MTTDEKEQEVEFFETKEMYALTDKVQSYDYIDSKNLDHSISGETEEDLENEVSNFLEDLHGEMVDLVKFINDNFKNITVELPATVDFDRWMKYYEERKEEIEDNAGKYITQYWIGYNKGKYHAYDSIIRTLQHLKDVFTS
jgi:primase-polymerase (primpol)-like protein